MEHNFDYDIIVIGLGPAGMAVSAMAPSMGMNVLAIEDHKVGGECLNYGCTPSKALLKAAEANFKANDLEKFGLKLNGSTTVQRPLKVVQEKVEAIKNGKTMGMFDKDKVEFMLQKGKASLVNENTVKVGDETYTGGFIFIATGAKPFIPPIPGLDTIDYLTNENIFAQKEVPESMNIIGGGSIGTEMAQAFSRLGTKVNVMHMDPYLIPVGDQEAGNLLQKKFEEEGIGVYNSTQIENVEKDGSQIIIHTDQGDFISDKILVATGRKPTIEALDLDNVGIEYDKTGITVDEYLRTNIKNIFAIGDVNGIAQLSHAAMHQGMLSLMNAISPQPIESLKRSNYLVPWSVFTKPEVAQVGMTEQEAKEQDIDYMMVRTEYEDYGRNLTDGDETGFIKVVTDKKGTIYGATLVGNGSSELVHEWTMAMQNRLSLFNIAMMQHSFPTLSIMNKRIGENWLQMMAELGAMEEMMANL